LAAALRPIRRILPALLNLSRAALPSQQRLRPGAPARHPLAYCARLLGLLWRSHVLASRRYALLARETMATAVSLKSLVTLMRGAPEDVHTQTWCCHLLCKRPQAELADGADAVVAVVAALRIFLVKSAWRSLCHSVVALSTLAAAGVGNRQAAASVGALDAVLAAMGAAAGDAMLQFSGCSALGQLGVGGRVLRADGATEAAVSAIVAAHRAHPDHEQVLAETQHAIRCIILESANFSATGAYSVAAVEAAVKAGAIEMLNAQIRTHTRNGNKDELVNCFNVLGYLYTPREHCDRKRALAVASMTVVVAAMAAQAAVALTQRQGCFVLSNLARHAPGQAMVRAGGLSAAIGALLEHTSDSGVQYSACRVLESACAAAAANTAFAVGRGAAAGVIAAMRTYPGKEDLQLVACCTLCSFTALLTNEQVHAAGMAAAVEPLTAALRAYPANPSLQRPGCYVLARIISQHIAPAQCAVETGAIEAILTAMVTISDAVSTAAGMYSPSAYQAGCDALDLMLNLGTATELRAVCAVAAIEDVVVATRGLQSHYQSDVDACARVHQRLHAAVLRHDRSRCINAGCMRCAAARERGALCALPSCGARARPDGKRLKRCGRCLVAAYCCEAHQREHWPTHRPLCSAAAPAADADAPVGADDASPAMERLSI
jgi:hypothetical protein